MGDRWGELSASIGPFNAERCCRSYANESGYHIQVDNRGLNMLTNKKND